MKCSTDGTTFTFKFTATNQTVSIGSMTVVNYVNGKETSSFPISGLLITLTPGQSQTFSSTPIYNGDTPTSCAIATWSPNQ